MMKTSLTGQMRAAGLFMRTTAATVTITFGMLVLAPAAAAVQAPAASTTVSVNDQSRLATVFGEITVKLDALEQARADGDTVAIEALVTELRALEDQITPLDTAVIASFDAVKSDIEAKGLPQKILDRQNHMMTHYRVHRDAVLSQLGQIGQGQWLWRAKKWLKDVQQQFMGGTAEVLIESPYPDADRKKFRRSQQPFDPRNLPNKSLKRDPANKPKNSKAAFQRAQLFNTPVTRLAALGDFGYDQLSGAGDPAYLAPNDEVLLTQPIIDQAAVLNHDPVAIYHWVRNNIEWQPSWGAVQDAELTLDARRGNAMDIASLTIALLRASQIPARYVHGTIDVPIEQFNNWAGGFTSSDAAVDYAASGGIPTAAMTAGGQISDARIEHVWVEAAIDYFPSRGAVNRDADAWVQLDPSFKQYEYLTGLDAVAISGIDTNQLANDFLASGTVNETEGWISGFDPTILEAAQAQAQTALEDYITTSLPNPTVGDVIGGRKTIIQEYPALPSSLPNPIVVEGARYDRLPLQLQQRVTYSLGRDALGQPVNPTAFAYATLNNEKVTLSFRPATAEDEAALLALLPEGEITDVSQLPSSIPSYLIEVIPEFKVNGELKISGEPMALGQELVFNTTIDFPGRSKRENYDYNVIAGSFLSVNVVAGSVSSSKFAKLNESLGGMATNLSDGDSLTNMTINRENTLGDMFYLASLSYFAELLAVTRAMAEGSKASYSFSVGYGTVGYVPRVNYLFGFPVDIRAGAIGLDIPISIVSVAASGYPEKQKQFVSGFGTISSVLEHAVPEQVFYDGESEKLDFMSAMKGMQKALSEGQNIYHITEDNITDTLPLISAGSDTLDEVIASVHAGLTVTIHENPVSVPGFTGTGYIILDKQTGNGAYKISGGGNGGEGELAATSAGVATGVTGLLVASVDSVVGSFSSYADDIKLLQKLMSRMAVFASGLKLLYDLYNDECTSNLAKFIIFAAFAALTALLVAAIPTIAAVVATAGPAISTALPSLLLSIAGSVAIDEIIKRVQGLIGC